MSTVKSFVDTARKFTSEEVKSPILEKGKHKIRLVNFSIIHSGITNLGEIKERVTEYEDVTTQVYAEFGSTEGKGAIAHRFQIEGFKAYNKLTPDELESGKFEPSDEGYALVEKNGKKYRMPDEENTAAAIRILSQAFKAMGLPAGSTLEDMQTVIDERREFYGIVRMRTWENKEYPELHYLQAIKTEVPIDDEAFD